MLIQQTVHPNTEEILIEQRQLIFLKGSLGRNLVQISVVLLFLHYHRQTRILSCVFFNVFNSSPSLLDRLKSTPFFFFLSFCFQKDAALLDYYLERGRYLRRLRLLRHFEITGHLLELTSFPSSTVN